jgi:hypothetical protein
VEAIGFLNSPTNVINEKYLQKNVPPPKWHGVLLTLIDPKLAKLDLFGLQRKVFSWFDTNQQIKFIACVFDLNAASADFRKFLLLEVSKQLDRTPPDPKQLQTCTSMFYKHEHFREQVLALKNIARNLDDGGSYDLQLAEQLVACFDKAIRPKPDNLGALQPVYNLYDKLKEIYLSEGKSPDKAAVHAINILKAFSGGDGRSLYKLLELKWDMQLETRFAGGTTQSQHSTQRPPREKTPTGRQASPKRSEAEPKPHPTHPQGYMGPNQSGTGKQSARVYIVVSLLAVGAIGLFAIGFTAGRSQSVAVVDHVGDGIDQNETSSSNALEDGEGPPPEPVVETPDNSGGGTVNTGQTDSEKAAAEAKKKAAAEKAAAEKADAEKADADKTAADKTAADKMAADKKAADKTAADKTAADKKAADKRAADLANKRVVHQPLGQGNGKRDDNFTPPLDKLYFHEIKLAELTAVTPKIIAIPAGDLRAPKPGWPQPGQFNIRKSEKTENLWEVVRDEDKLTYAYFEWVPGKRLLRVYRAQPGNNVPEKQFGAKATIPAEPNKQQVERLDRRGNRFLSYCHLIQLDEKTFFSMGLNQALAPRAGKKTAENLMRRKFNTDPFLAPSTPLLNHMADLRLVSKPSTWSIELDKVYVTGGQTSSKAYKAVPANAFAGTPNSNEGTSGGKYSGLKCKYTDFAMRVRFVAQTSQIQVWPEGTFKSLEELMEKQVAVRVQEYRLDELMKKPTGDDKKLNDFRIVEINRAKKNLAEAKGAVAEFMKNNSKLKDLRDDPEATAALVTYYRSVNKTKGLSVSLTISRRQNINGQEVVIPFWYPVIP